MAVDVTANSTNTSEIKLSKMGQALEQTLLVKFFEAAWAAAETKKPLVRARSLLELYRFMQYRHVRDKIPLSSDRLARIRAAVRPLFDQLPARDQQLLLIAAHWKRLGGVEFLPALRKFIAVAPEHKEGDDPPSPLDSAFRRVLELMPKEGHALILAELRRAKPRATRHSLTLLPDQPIPELDDSLATRLEESISDLDDAELAATLVARYGSAAIYDRARKVYGDNGGSWPCALQASMLAYFVRHKPRQGIQLVNQALDAREQTGCYRHVLTEVARIRMTAELERVAITRLDDRNVQVATDAVWLFWERGSAATEQAMWRRFEKWHDEWKDHVDEIAAVNDGSPASPQFAFERSFVRALAHSKSWMTAPPKLKRLRTLCLTKPSQGKVDGLLNAWREPVAIRFSPGTDSESPSARIWPYPSRYGRPVNDNWYVAQYHVRSLAELKKLLARFPDGTTLSFPIGMLTDAPAEERLFSELKQHVESRGLKLVKSPRPE